MVSISAPQAGASSEEVITRTAEGFADTCYRMGYGCAQEISSRWVQLQVGGRPTRSMWELQERTNEFIDRTLGIE